MLIYVIEDDPIKGSKICQYLAEQYVRFEIHMMKSYQSGLKAIEEKKPDLIILDMTLPTFDRTPGKREGRIRSLGGYELIRKVKLRSIKLWFIIVSQLEYFGEGSNKITFEQVTVSCAEEFSDMFVGSVYFTQTSLAWQERLSEFVENVISRHIPSSE